MLKKLIRNLVLGEKASSEKFIEYLRKQGVQVGQGVRFYSPSNTLVDVSRPWLVSIGDNVRITHGVVILTHDYAWSVIKKHPDSQGVVLGAEGGVKIGNNVFIGMNAVITRGVTIGDNVVIGAGSVVTKDCESGFVYAGNPARKLMDIRQFAHKRKQAQFEEARSMVLRHRAVYGTNPPKEALSEYFMLFCTAEEGAKVPAFRQKMETGGNYGETVAYMQSNPPMFNSYEAFLGACDE